MSGKLEDAVHCVRGGQEKEWIDCVAGDIRIIEIRDAWRDAASEPRTWYGIVSEGASGFIAASRQKKRDT